MPTLPTSCSKPASRTRLIRVLGQSELAGHHLGVATDRLGVARGAAEAQVGGRGEIEHHRGEPLALDVAPPGAVLSVGLRVRLYTTLRLRPLSLAAYRASSAARSSDAAVSP